MPLLKTDLPRSFPKGTELTNSLVNAILRELWRWRRVQAAAPLTIDYAESDQPPIISYTPPGTTFDSAWGTTPTGGYTGGSISTPASNATTMTLYPVPGNTSVSISASTTYSTYNGTVAAGKTAYYNRAPDGKWYVITADC